LEDSLSVDLEVSARGLVTPLLRRRHVEELGERLLRGLEDGFGVVGNLLRLRRLRDRAFLGHLEVLGEPVEQRRLLTDLV
jgi:hypothetical protein